MKIRFCLLFLFCAMAVAAQTKVPHGKPVLMDGHVEKSEWRDAAVIPLDDFARVYVKESGEFVWLALELLKDKNGTLTSIYPPTTGRFMICTRRRNSASGN